MGHKLRTSYVDRLYWPDPPYINRYWLSTPVNKRDCRFLYLNFTINWKWYLRMTIEAGRSLNYDAVWLS